MSDGLAGGTLTRVSLDTSGPLRHWQAHRTLLRLVRHEQVGVVHGRSAETAMLAAELGQRAGVATLATPHELPDPDSRQDAPYRAALARLGCVVAVSEYAAEHLVQRLGLPAEQVRLVPPGVDLREIDPERVRGHRVAAAAERCGLGLGPRIVGVPLDIAVGDGRDLLIATVARLVGADFQLLFLGAMPSGGTGLTALGAALRQAGLHERARFGTGIEDLAAMLATIDVLLVPATCPAPTASLAMAAQAMGKPIIVTNIGSLPEAVMPAVTGWLLPPDPTELAWALQLALEMDDGVRERVARRARGFIAENFAQTYTMQRQIELYAELLACSAGTSPTAPEAA
jgi:glycosyltransferase involved in cell wall biosynthesis